MAAFDLAEHPHRRFNQLTRRFILCSPHRTRRPWRGQVEDSAATPSPTFDPDCYLCPGNARAGGARNPGAPPGWARRTPAAGPMVGG